MKKLLLLSALLIFVFSSDLFAQDYMKLRKKQLRIEHQKKLKLIDSLSQELSLSNKKSQNLQSNLNNSSNDLILTSDSLKNSNLEINQLEVKLLASKNELSLLGLEIDNLVKQNSDNLDLIADKNLQIDSLKTLLNIASDEKSDSISQDSLKTITIDYLKIENNDLKDKLNEDKNKFICNEEQPKYEDYGDDECEFIIRERNCVFKNLLINTKNEVGTCGAGGTDISWNSRYFEIVNSEILKEKNLQTFFRHSDILLNIINSQFEFEFFKLYESDKDCFNESFYKKRGWNEINLRINSDGFLFYTWNYSVQGYCEFSIGELEFTIDTNNLLKFIKVKELDDLSLNKLLENWESKVIENKNLTK